MQECMSITITSTPTTTTVHPQCGNKSMNQTLLRRTLATRVTEQGILGNI